MEKYYGVIESLSGLLKIKSIIDAPKNDMPFGEENNRALLYMLELGKSFGFGIKNVDGYAGHIEFGEGEEVFGVLCHLDVVPEGDIKTWTHPPFGGEIHSGAMFGRGAEDDKGPAVAALYAMKRLKDEGFAPSKKCRLILGLNEESGWKCIEYYLEKEQKPASGFSPDSDFPVIFCEKGVLHFELKYGIGKNNFDFIRGGHRVNMVPDFAEFKQSGEVRKFKGKSAHGARPFEGVNAIHKMLVALKDRNGIFKKIDGLFCKKTGLKKLGLNIKDEVSGELTVNLGTINLKCETLCLGVDVRYPVTFEKSLIMAAINSNSDADEVSVSGCHAPLYIPKNDGLIVSLLKAYEKVTGEKGEPIAIGGATYSRAIDKCAAFGPCFPGEASSIHQKNENIKIENLYKLCDIYYEALKLLL